jgi:uncharacterized protein (TIGR03084 family)
MSAEVFDDLQAEQDALEEVLSGLGDDAWSSPSAAPGWSVADVVLHLAQTEEAVVAAAAGDGSRQHGSWRRLGTTVDEVMEALVHAEPAPGAVVLTRWKGARRAAVEALRAADPQRPLHWVETPLKPRTLATTRLAEHWAHALDITGPLGIPYPDTGRLRHVAWLGHSSLPYAFARAGQQPQQIYCELTAPDGQEWRFGPPDASSSVAGPAGAFCRVGARRLSPESSGLAVRGPHGLTALRLLRTYAA